MERHDEVSLHDVDYIISLYGYVAVVRRVAHLLRASVPHLRGIAGWKGAPADALTEASRADMAASLLEGATLAMEHLWPAEKERQERDDG